MRIVECPKCHKKQELHVNIFSCKYCEYESQAYKDYMFLCQFGLEPPI